MARVIRQPAIELARLADVMEHQHAASHVTRTVTDRCRRAFDIQLIAVAADEQHGPNGLDRPDAADRDAQRILQRLAGLFVEGPEDLFDGPPHRIFETPSRQLFSDRVDVVDRGVGIGRDDAITDRLQGDLRALLLTEQRFLVNLALSDIELDADEPQTAARACPRAPSHGC